MNYVKLSIYGSLRGVGDQFNHNCVNHQLLETIGLISDSKALGDCFFFSAGSDIGACEWHPRVAMSKSHFPLSVNKLNYKQLRKLYSELLNGVEIGCIGNSHFSRASVAWRRE